MKRILLKTILIALTLFIGMIIIIILQFINKQHTGIVVLGIIGTGMVAGIRAIWKYNPTSKEIDLKKDD